MCLAVPGEIVSVSEESGDVFARRGKVRFGGIIKEVHLGYVPEAAVGDYVLVHVGFAISRIDEQEARRVLEFLSQVDELKKIEKKAADARSRKREIS